MGLRSTTYTWALSVGLVGACAAYEPPPDELASAEARPSVQAGEASTAARPVACASIDSSGVFEGANDVAPVAAMLTSLCACAASDTSPDYGFTVDVGENSRTLVLHRFTGGERARTCFLDVVAGFMPPSRFRTRFALVPAPGTTSTPSRSADSEQADLDAFNAAMLDVSSGDDAQVCPDPTISPDRAGCTYQLDYTAESLANGVTNTVGVGMAVREANGRACLVRTAREIRPPKHWRFEWSIVPHGEVC